jgi:hypothetical protein
MDFVLWFIPENPEAVAFHASHRYESKAACEQILANAEDFLGPSLRGAEVVLVSGERGRIAFADCGPINSPPQREDSDD